jgi:cation-dependent mannose-6-phosphate receptor
MHFSSAASALLLVPVFQAQLSAAVPEDKPDPPCTVRSLNTGSFFDLNPISIRPDNKEKREVSWLARGYDYSVNFTINFCAPVVENLKDVVGLEREQWGNVSAFYEDSGKIYSIGYVQLHPSGLMIKGLWRRAIGRHGQV